MTKKHFLWLLMGILVWGSFPAITAAFLFNISSREVVNIVIKFVLFTGVLTLIVQYYVGGFYPGSPRKWFFVPLLSWLIIIIWGTIEITLLGEWDLWREMRGIVE